MTSVPECLSKAAEFESRAAIATDWQLKATFKDLARFHRQLARHMEETDIKNMKPQTIHLQAGDKIALQYLGAAVVLQWANLPETAQQAVLQQANSVGGLPPVTSLHEQIKALIRCSRDVEGVIVPATFGIVPT
jgi:predicted exporter